MPDLSHKAVHQFWNDYQDPIIYRVISFMEGVEDWTIDGDPKFEAALNELGNALEDIGNIDLALEKDMIELATYIKTGRCLRLAPLLKYSCMLRKLQNRTKTPQEFFCVVILFSNDCDC